MIEAEASRLSSAFCAEQRNSDTTLQSCNPTGPHRTSTASNASNGHGARHSWLTWNGFRLELSFEAREAGILTTLPAPGRAESPPDSFALGSAARPLADLSAPPPFLALHIASLSFLERHSSSITFVCAVACGCVGATEGVVVQCCLARDHCFVGVAVGN